MFKKWILKLFMEELRLLGEMPPEVVWAVLEQCSLFDLLKIRLVSKRLNEIVNDSGVWKKRFDRITAIMDMPCEHFKKRNKVIETAKVNSDFALKVVFYKPVSNLLLRDFEDIKAIGETLAEIEKQQFLDQALHGCRENHKFSTGSRIQKELGGQVDQVQLDQKLSDCLKEYNVNIAEGLITMGAQGELDQFDQMLSVRADNEHFSRVNAWRSRIEGWREKALNNQKTQRQLEGLVITSKFQG